jgi:hypothetical protein
MKRSEALKAIENILRENLHQRYYDVKHEDVAKELLNKLEELGMVPPNGYHFPTPDEIKQGYYPVPFLSNRWEQE